MIIRFYPTFWLKNGFFIVSALFWWSTAQAIDNPHFYRATFFWDEPRLERPGLTTFETAIGFGQAHHAYNDRGQKTSLLNIFGPHGFCALGKDNPMLDALDPLDQIIINLAQLPCHGTFGQMQLNGHFRFFEAQFQIYQNLINGFFLQAHMPVRTLSITNITMSDLSPDEGFLSKNTPEWLAFLAHFQAITQRHFLHLGDTTSSGIGDLSFLAGWARTYHETTYLDFIDVSAKIGILLATSKRTAITHPFQLPLGYNGHMGVPLKFDCSIGYLEWLTFGTHIGALFLLKRHEEIALPTSEQQNGFIFFARDYAKVDPGTYWDIACYAKADHFCKGVSLLLGYLYTHKDSDCIKPYNKLFDPLIVNNDKRFKSWTMHQLSFMVEWDSNHTSNEYKPIVALFYNYIISGKNIFAAASTTLRGGINICWTID